MWDQDPKIQRDTGSIVTLQHVPKPLTKHRNPENYQLPREGNHTRRTAPTWRLPTGLE